MKWFQNLFKPKDLPKVYKNLIEVIGQKSDSIGGENRAAIAELQALSAWELNKATKGLKFATWVLALSTVVLCILTIING